MSPARSKPLAALYWGSIGTTALAAVLVITTFWLAARTQSEDRWVRHTLDVRNEISQIHFLVRRAESNVRGYLLTGDNAYLKLYESGRSELPAAINKLSALVANNPHQIETLAPLRELASARLLELRKAIDQRQSGQHETPLAMKDTAAELRSMYKLRDLLHSMTEEENRQLSVRLARWGTLGKLSQIGAGISFLLVCAGGILATILTKRSFTELAAARDRLMLTNQELIEQINLRESAESQLRQAQKMEAIGQLTGGIAHDFNNMLGVISGSLDLVQRRIKKGDFKIDRFMEAALKASDRAAALTHRLLAFARQQPLSPEPLDANKMIANMSDLLRSTLGEHISIETVSAAGLWRTKADAHQLENAILNVAINARDAMPDGGKLTIETGNAYLDEAYCRQHGEMDAGQFVMIAITDTGIGMKPETVARVFDPFFTTKPTGVGTGLGLSQVYGFVKQSNGHINIYSEIDCGTTVKIYLPRFNGDTQQLAPIQDVPMQTGNAREVILLVEDDPLMRRLTSEALHELGYTVYDSAKACDALAILTHTPDIKMLLTDVVMPEINGKKLADEATRQRPDLKVLFTTGYTPNAVVHSGMLDTGVHFLAKPFTLAQLAAKVRSVLDA